MFTIPHAIFKSLSCSMLSIKLNAMQHLPNKEKLSNHFQLRQTRTSNKTVPSKTFMLDCARVCVFSYLTNGVQPALSFRLGSTPRARSFRTSSTSPCKDDQGENIRAVLMRLTVTWHLPLNGQSYSPLEYKIPTFDTVAVVLHWC